MKILLIKTSSFGDIIHALPVAAELRRQLPGARLTWVANAEFEPILRLCPAVDQVLGFTRSRLLDHLYWSEFVFRDLQTDQYDLVIDLQCLLKSGLLTLCARGRRKVGLQDGREGSRFFYHDIVRWSEPRLHAVDRYLKVVPFLGLKPGPVTFPLNLPTGEYRFSAPLQGRTYVVINAFSRGAWKRWRLSGFQQVTDALPEIRFVLIGQKRDEIESHLLDAPNVINLTGKTTLVDLARILGGASMLLTNDSGPMHLAVALGRPVLALFGKSDPVMTGPYGYSDRSVMRFSAFEAHETFSLLKHGPQTPFSLQVIERMGEILSAKVA
ncbi:MAG: glycosyltransferase family 9 protein [Verrucomicrobiae bacterium]|nr:glycosyltransferase family 9 protein [Verrucomicrobiae bacterium]